MLRASLRDAELVRLGRLLDFPDFQTFRLEPRPVEWNTAVVHCCCCWREPQLTVAAVRRPLDLHLLFTSPLAVCMLQC